MNGCRILIREIMKSTILTLSLFLIFDLVFHGYAQYHNWILIFTVPCFIVYLSVLIYEHDRDNSE